MIMLKYATNAEFDAFTIAQSHRLEAIRELRACLVSAKTLADKLAYKAMIKKLEGIKL